MSVESVGELELNILVFNAGKFSSLDGSVVRFKHLALERDERVSVVWVDGSEQKIYKTEDLDSKVPEGVAIVSGLKPSSSKLGELIGRERHFLKYAKKYADWADVAVFYSPWGCALARRALRKRGVPLVFDYIDLIHAFRNNRLERFASRAAVVRALKSSDVVVTTAFKLYQDAGRYNKHVVLIPNGVDFKKIRVAKPLPLKKGLVRKPAVGFVGGFGKWVDFDSVIGAARLLPSVNFYFIGDGVQREKLESAARELKNVRVSPQFVPHQQAFEWMASMDACLIPFRKSELTDAVCPIKLFEYWALEKPVVGSYTFELLRIAGDSALYASNARSYARAVEKLVASAALRRKLGRKGLRIARKYDWNALSKQFLRVLRRASEKRMGVNAVIKVERGLK